MQPVVCRSSGKGFEEFKEFERLGSWEEQILTFTFSGAVVRPQPRTPNDPHP